MKYFIVTLCLFFSSFSFAENLGKFDLSGSGLVTGETKNSCRDDQGQQYSSGKTVEFTKEGQTYVLTCDSRGNYYYAWEVYSVTRSIYSSKTWDDGLGCRDVHNRIIEKDKTISDQAGTYICREKNGLHYLVLK